MSHFQPGALTISRAKEWRAKRERNERVLGFRGLEPAFARRIGEIVQAATAARCGASGFPR